jgi:hypothetical protein
VSFDNSYQIKQFFHCGRCVKDKPPGISYKAYACFEVGWTEFGLQVWCARHNANVVHIDFEGNQHPAITKAKRVS